MEDLEVGRTYKRVLSDKHYKCIGIDKNKNIVFFSPIYRDYLDCTTIVTDHTTIHSYMLHDIDHYFEEV